jgi:hypothetical protein
LKVEYELTISLDEAIHGTRKILVRTDKRLAVTIPFGVKTGTVVKLTGALQITDGCPGDILIRIRVKVKQRERRYFPSVVLIVVLIIIFSVILASSLTGGGDTGDVSTAQDSGNVAQPPITKTTEAAAESVIDSDYITVFHDIQPPWYYIRGTPIHLTNNATATDPTWQQLRRFLISDKTDSELYRPGLYECGHFAAEVYNNAEAAGINAAFVAVFFSDEMDGHAVNAFTTVDKGLIYIDCQGPELTDVLSDTYVDGMYDKRVYIEKGKTMRVESIRTSLFRGYVIFFQAEGKVESVEIYW